MEFDINLFLLEKKIFRRILNFNLVTKKKMVMEWIYFVSWYVEDLAYIYFLRIQIIESLIMVNIKAKEAYMCPCKTTYDVSRGYNNMITCVNESRYNLESQWES